MPLHYTSERKGGLWMINNQITEKLARHVEASDEIKLNDELTNQIKRVYLDYVCCSILGSSTNVSNLAYQTILSLEGEGEYNVIGYKQRLSKASAAFINGTSAHSLDLDDGHTKGSIHPGTVVLPALISEAERLKPTFEELAKATIIGYDVCLRISSAIHPSSRKRGFHNTPVAGIFGAIAALCVLNKFEKEEIQNAFGIGASFAGGLFAFLGTGSEVKRIHPGQAARDAILAVELSKNGLTGPKSVLESENGIFQAFAGGEISLERLFHDIGERFEIMDIYFKPYPCCRHLHSSIDAVYELKGKNQIDLNAISSIRVGVNSIAYKHRHNEFYSLLDAQMSLPFAVAAALYFPTLEIGNFEPKDAPELLKKLSKLVEVYIDKRAEDVYPHKRPATIEVTFNNGEPITEHVENPLGEPSNPLPDNMLDEKFYGNCRAIIGENEARELINKIRNMEKGIEFLFHI